MIHLADHSDEFEQPKIFRILRSCSRLICITEDMRTKYETMLSRKDIEVLHNGSESRCFNLSVPPLTPFDETNPFKLCFLGGLFSHLHGKCIEDVLEAVDQLRKQRSWLEFHLYGQINPKNFLLEQLRATGITHHGIVMPLDKKYEIMEEAHCFIIPSSFNEQNHKHYRYSFPTKLPELIASGRPILSYGPSDTATNRLLIANQLGIRIHQRSVEKLVEALTKIMDLYADTVSQIASDNSRIRQRFSATKVREKLAKVLNL